MLTLKTRNSSRRIAALCGKAVGIAGALGLALGVFSANAASVTVTTLAGGPYLNKNVWAGYIDGVNPYSQFNGPSGCALDSSGLLYIADKNNNAIRVMGVDTNASGTTSTLLKFATLLSPVGVAVDGSDNLYIVTAQDCSLRKYDIKANQFLWTNKFASVPSAVTVARDISANAYVALTNGSVYCVSPSGVCSSLYTKFKSPLGLAWMPTGRIAVSDGGNNSIWLLNPAARTVQWLTGLTNKAAGFKDGAKTVVQFNQPAGIAAAGDGSLVVADKLNHRVRLVASDGAVSTLYGVSSSAWVATNYWRGWLDSSAGTPEARKPAGVAISPNGTIYVTELYYDLVRQATGSGLSSTNPPPSAPSFSPTYGYFLSPQTITVSNAFGDVYYTVDGSDPKVNGIRVVNGQILWNDSFHDLSSLQMRAYYGGSWSPIVAGQLMTPSTPVITPECGFYPNGKDIIVSNAVGSVVFYSTDGSEPTILSTAIALTNGLGVIHWSNSSHGLNWLHLRSSTALNQLSATVSGENCPLDAPVISPQSGIFTNSIQIAVASSYSGFIRIFYNTDGTDPTMKSTELSLDANNRGTINWPANKDIALFRLIAYSGPDNPSPVSGGVASVFPPTTPTFAPMSGYFASGKTITVYNTVGNVYYTTDGAEPTTSSAQVAMVDGVGTFLWSDGLHDLSYLRIKAFNGTLTSPTVSGLASSANTLGVARNVIAGIGSTIVVPVVANLVADQSLRSLYFRLEIVPFTSNASSSSAMLPIKNVIISTNDFAPVVQETSDGNPLNIHFQTYQNGVTNGLAFDSVGGNLLVQNYGVIANLNIRIPTNALSGDQYGINILSFSGASDAAGQHLLSITPMNATLTVSNIAYRAGGCASGSWYNAGDFGSTALSISDVNAAYDASVGIHVPPPYSDVFNAMDVYPETTKLIGDGQITYLDWQHILLRSEGMEANNWMRSWSTNGLMHWFIAAPALKAQPLAQALTVPQTDAVWVPKALISAGTVENASPGATVSLPVYAKVLRGFNLAGLQFRAVLETPSNAPAPGALSFIRSQGMIAPRMGPSAQNEAICAWDLGSLTAPLQGGSNLLGYVQFTVPSTAQAGQCYSVKVIYPDGAADLDTGYAMESASGSVWVGVDAPPAGHFVSDEWKQHFFGGATNALSDPDADADGDGVPNWQEYLAGTDPTNAASRLVFSGVASQTNAALPCVTLHWLSAPGRDYAIESCAQLSGASWSSVTTNIPGDGSSCSYTQTNPSGGARFYRIRLQ